MKKITLIGLAAVWLGLSASLPAVAQLRGARGYTQRIAPLLPPQPPPFRPPAQPAVAAAAPAAPVDPEKAKADKDAALKRTIEFQKKRAEAGSATAQFDLGVRYLTGDGVEKDLSQARKWIEAAAKNGHTYAPKKLEELSKLEKAAPAKKRE